MHVHRKNRAAADWHREDIKAALRKKSGRPLSGLSEDWGFNEGAISTCLLRPWWAVEVKISQFLGVRPEIIWPTRYSSDGHPISLRGRGRPRGAS